jgi:hypothetical protein
VGRLCALNFVTSMTRFCTSRAVWIIDEGQPSLRRRSGQLRPPLRSLRSSHYVIVSQSSHSVRNLLPSNRSHIRSKRRTLVAKEVLWLLAIALSCPRRFCSTRACSAFIQLSGAASAELGISERAIPLTCCSCSRFHDIEKL